MFYIHNFKFVAIVWFIFKKLSLEQRFKLWTWNMTTLVNLEMTSFLQSISETKSLTLILLIMDSSRFKWKVYLRWGPSYHMFTSPHPPPTLKSPYWPIDGGDTLWADWITPKLNYFSLIGRNLSYILPWCQFHCLWLETLSKTALLHRWLLEGGLYCSGNFNFILLKAVSVRHIMSWPFIITMNQPAASASQINL